MERIMGERHVLVRSAVRAGVLKATDPVSYYHEAKALAIQDKAPRRNLVPYLRYVGDLVRATEKGRDFVDPEIATLAASPIIEVKGATPEAVAEIREMIERGANDPDFSMVTPHEVHFHKPEDAKIAAELDELDTDDWFVDEAAEPAGSPLGKKLREVAAELAAKKRFKPVWQPFELDGKQFYLASTWRMRCDGYEWNFTGTTGNRAVLHRCDEQVLHFEGESAVCANEDIEDCVLALPANNKAVKNTAFAGKPTKVEATVFLWLLRYVPNREFRFWLNEKRSAKSPGVKPHEDIWTVRKTMPATFPQPEPAK